MSEEELARKVDGELVYRRKYRRRLKKKMLEDPGAKIAGNVPTVG